MEKENWKEIESFIRNALSKVQSKVDFESIMEVEHYLNHDEFEMAFEGLFIEIMKLNEKPAIDLTKSKEIAEWLKLDEESVFDIEFWNNFTNYIMQQSNS